MNFLLLLASLWSLSLAKKPYPKPSEMLELAPEGRYMKPEERRLYLGAKLDNKSFSKDHREKLPKNFVAGWDDWEECQSTIAYIKDQAACGSCWAVAASEVVAHRTCIACGGTKQCKDTEAYPELLNEARPCIDASAEQILSCCNWCGDGCQGGYPIDAMQFWAKTGVVSGGWYGSRCGCQPYEIAPHAASHGTPKCSGSCEDGYPLTFDQDKNFANDARTIVGEEAIMEEIYHHGSVECAFSVYSNFMSYKNGIYNHAGGYLEGGHAVTVIGWGELGDGRKYWVINNSWNVTWGANGMFFWEKGTDLCGMESQCVAGTPKCNQANNVLKCL